MVHARRRLRQGRSPEGGRLAGGGGGAGPTSWAWSAAQDGDGEAPAAAHGDFVEAAGRDPLGLQEPARPGGAGERRIPVRRRGSRFVGTRADRDAIRQRGGGCSDVRVAVSRVRLTGPGGGTFRTVPVSVVAVSVGAATGGGGWELPVESAGASPVSPPYRSTRNMVTAAAPVTPAPASQRARRGDLGGATVTGAVAASSRTVGSELMSKGPVRSPMTASEKAPAVA